ncbi:hypothetical protein ABTK10_20070, partial [Acinetobacter baumannii]
MKATWRIGLTLAGAAASAAAFAALWPHAREASALLLAQDHPARLADIQVNSALRTHSDALGQGAAQALDDNDADL